jgi:hypothetical protein
VKAFAQIRGGKIADAQRTVAQLREEAKKWPDNNWLQTDVEMLSDEVAALAAKDRKAGAALLAKCPPDNFTWKLAFLRQMEKDGDKAGAEQLARTSSGGRSGTSVTRWSLA